MALQLGLNANAKELPAALATFPGMRFCRVFGGPGNGIPSWTAPAMVALRKARAVAWVSFKDWASDTLALAALNVWLDTLPVDVPEVWLTYNHEPEGDLSSYEYRRRWVLLAKAVRAHPNAHRIKIIPIHTLYPSRHKIGDRFDTDWTKWVGIWQQWAPTYDNGRYVGDYMGWDCYLETTATAYEPPESFFRVPIGAAHSMGVPLAVPELGALRLASDKAGTGRSRWIGRCLTHLRAHQAVAVAWWHGTGKAGHDYRLDDIPSIQAWRDAVLAQPA